MTSIICVLITESIQDSVPQHRIVRREQLDLVLVSGLLGMGSH